MKRRHKIMIARLIIAFLLLILAIAFAQYPLINFLLYLGAYLFAGYDVLWNAIRNILHGQVFDENFLMAIATIGAWVLSEYPEAVAVMVFYQIGELFQSIAVGKSRRSIASLMDIRPDRAVVLREGREVECSPEEVDIGEVLVIRPGDRIPLDGIVEHGESQINTAALTGESLPRTVGVEDSVISGTVNMSGLIRVRVLRPFAESTVNRILDLVENAAEGKAKTERFITRFSRWYTPCVVVCALLLALIPPVIFGHFSLWIHRALIFLVVSCPCALVISVPLSFFGGIGCASKKGILIKGANYMEALAKMKTIVFDKTGTLTKGGFHVVSVETVEMERDELLEIAALAESYSNHPIAKSIVDAYGKEFDQNRIEEVQEYSGKGICAKIDGRIVAAGNERFMQSLEIDIPKINYIGTIVYLAINEKYVGFIVIADETREGAEAAISTLKAEGIEHAIMLSGDVETVALSVGKKLGLDRIFSELLPHQKVEKMEEILRNKSNGTMVAYVGDGINDAPVLTRADVGIAMGALGSDAAIEAADIVLMDDDLSKLSKAHRISKKTMKIVWQNIIFAIGIKVLVMILGAFGLAGMWLAIFADVGVMILAILNAMRALKL